MPRLVIRDASRLEDLKVRTIKSFEHHEITRKGPRHWICKQPSRSTFWFGVTMGPCFVAVYGDIGDLILRPHSAGHRVLQWAKSACKNPDQADYVLGKAPQSQEVTEFSPSEAKEELREFNERINEEEMDEKEDHAKSFPGETFEPSKEITDQRKILEEIRSTWDGESQHSWYDACCMTDYEEPGANEVWTSEALWCYHALCWLIQHLGPDGEVL